MLITIRLFGNHLAYCPLSNGRSALRLLGFSLGAWFGLVQFGIDPKTV